MYYQSEPVSLEKFLDYLDKLPWCKQGETTLVAVYHCSPPIIEVIKNHDIKIYPGHMTIKLNKATLHMLENKFKEGEPVPLLLVWKDDGLEMTFRSHKSADFPYDTWENPAAAAYEREAVFIAADELGEKITDCFRKHLSSANKCPAKIPAL